MAGIQFRGAENVIRAYERREIPSWALFSGKQFLFPYVTDNIGDGANVLREYLDMFVEGGQPMTLTLKVYEDPGGKINDKTPCDGSFNFQLHEKDESYQRTGMSGSLERRLAGIEQRLAAPVEEEKEKGTLGAVMEYVENNEWAQNILMGLASKFLGIGEMAAIKQAMVLNGVEPGSAIASDQSRINEAVELLKKKIPNLGEVLMKLAKVDDTTLSFLVTQLNAM